MTDNINTINAKLGQLGVKIPSIYLPKNGIDLSRWSVVACDQYTSDMAYWDRVEKTVHDAPSTLRITLPEIFLEAPDVESKIKAIHQSMKNYIDQGILVEYGNTIVYIERNTSASGLRQGLLVAMDLERYDYARDSKTLIRATEGTIVDRIPPRLRVRKDASFELPHIMILIDDTENKLVKSAAAACATKKELYKIELMENGGMLSGWAIDNQNSLDEIATILAALFQNACASQNTTQPLFYAMGDGNHSLATAKAHWEATKKTLRESGVIDEVIMEHPARYALAEIVNIHSSGLRFEPIHRAVFSSNCKAMANYFKKHSLVKSFEPIDEKGLKNLLTSPWGQTRAGIFDGSEYFALEFTNSTNKLPTASIDDIFAAYKNENVSDARIDYIHGWDNTKKLGAEGALGCFVPVISRERLFSWVQQNGPLPRKSFSMGDAEEKRYYMECRKIT